MRRCRLCCWGAFETGQGRTCLLGTFALLLHPALVLTWCEVASRLCDPLASQFSPGQLVGFVPRKQLHWVRQGVRLEATTFANARTSGGWWLMPVIASDLLWAAPGAGAGR